MTRVRKPFIYLVIIALILATIGLLMIGGNPLGKIITGGATKSVEVYEIVEVMRHNSAESCWISSDNRVYDITLFLQIYEDESLKEKCGKILDLSSFSEDVREILKEYEIGRLK